MTLPIPDNHILILSPRERIQRAAENSLIWGGILLGVGALSAVNPIIAVTAVGMTIGIDKTVKHLMSLVTRGHTAPERQSHGRTAHIIRRAIQSWCAMANVDPPRLFLNREGQKYFGISSIKGLNYSSKTVESNIAVEVESSPREALIVAAHETAHHIRGDIRDSRHKRAGLFFFKTYGYALGLATAFALPVSTPVMVLTMLGGMLAALPACAHGLKKIGYMVGLPFIPPIRSENEAERIASELTGLKPTGYDLAPGVIRHCIKMGLPMPTAALNAVAQTGEKFAKGPGPISGFYNSLCNRLVRPVTMPRPPMFRNN